MFQKTYISCVLPFFSAKKTRHFVNGFPHSMEYHLISYIALLSTLPENPQSPDNLETPDF